jgi:nucleoid-associated protein YgaU
VESITINFTYFSSKGTPLRAEVSLQLKQAEAGDFGKQNPTSGTPYPHQVHRVQPGETLDRISARYYGDATKWRALAAANAVEDPLTIRPGSLLGIPPLEAM